MNQELYHLYHHSPDQEDLAAITDQAWLINNGATYNVVATISAATAERAYAGLLAKAQGQSLRSVDIKTDTILRPTQPGDVLVGKEKAWMLHPDGAMRPLPYQPSPCWKSYRHDASVTGLSWAPDGRYLAVCSNQVRLYHLEGDEEQRYAASYHRHDYSTVRAVAWSPDGTRIASGGTDGEVHIWKPHPEGRYGGAALGSILIARTQETTRYRNTITSLTWAHDSSTLLAGREDGQIVQWDARTGECLRVFPRHHAAIRILASAPTDSRIASASDDSTLRIWSLASAEPEVVCQHADKVCACAWSPDGTLLVSACQGEHALQLWDAHSGVPGERLPLSVSSTKSLTIHALAWSPDGRFIGAGCDDGTLQLVDRRTLRHTQTYRAAHASITAVAWSPDGHALAAGEESDNGVQVWRMDLAEEQRNEPLSSTRSV